jgi:hypothetical protein
MKRLRDIITDGVIIPKGNQGNNGLQGQDGIINRSEYEIRRQTVLNILKSEPELHQEVVSILRWKKINKIKSGKK